MHKQLLFETRARAALGRGIDALADAVKITLGPAGRNVALEQGFGAPLVTKDGVTVAKAIELQDRFENLGAQLVKEVSARTADIAGDGTTTATVLAQAIFREGSRLVAAGNDPGAIKRGIDKAVAAAVLSLQAQARPTRGEEEIAQVGTISANGDASIGKLIAQAMAKVGNDGVITLESAQGIETTLEVVLGMQLDRGWLASSFVTDLERNEVVFEDALVFLSERKLSAMRELLPLLELATQAKKPLLIIAEDVESDALATLVVNRLRGTLEVCAVRAPGFGDRRKSMLEDLALLTGATLYAEDRGLTLEKVTLADLGRASRIVVDREHTTIVGGGGTRAAIDGRVQQLRAQLKDITAGSDYDREKIEERLAKLAGGVAVLAVGAATETELKERKARVDDALHATRAAVEEGILPGGGVAYLRAQESLLALRLDLDEELGVAIVRRALEEPLRQIARNGGWEGSVVVERVRAGTGAFGFNARTGVYEDLILAGVIDPAKVARHALQNAASVASLLLTTEAMIAGSSA